jgi:hypothetical protein
MTRVKFAEVSLKATFRWRTADGKARQRTKKFWQTLNPFNIGKNGEPKNRYEIMDELQVQKRLWLLRMGNATTDQERETIE